jgi:hypothetical protein
MSDPVARWNEDVHNWSASGSLEPPPSPPIPTSADFPHLDQRTLAAFDAYEHAFATGEVTNCPVCKMLVRVKDRGHFVLFGIWHALTNVPQMTPIQ